MANNLLSKVSIDRTKSFNRINKIGGFLSKVGFSAIKLDADKIIKKAKKKAKHKGDIPKQAEEGLRVAVNSIIREGKPNPFGIISTKVLFETTLYGRLMIDKHLAKHPEIEKTEIREPVVIAGMPRTGTTILHAMLHEDPMFRSPLAWELILPYPVPKPDNVSNRDQIKKVKKRFDQLFKLVPDFKAKHYMDVDTPQECVGINMFDFNTFQIPLLYHIPTYLDWFNNKADKLETMRMHKRFLQYLQSGGVKADKWLLKTPVHLMRLPELFEVYPDAKIIITHRHPSKIIASVTSLIHSLRSLYSDHTDPTETAYEQANVWSLYFSRFLDSLKKLDKNDQIIHVKFDDFVKDQFGVIKGIYDQYGWNMTKEAEKRISTFIRENPKDKNGVHQYYLEDFGINEDYVNKRFEKYIEFLNQL
jgi:hypothetical protein